MISKLNYREVNGYEDISRGINHIGLTVPDIEEATEFFKKV